MRVGAETRESPDTDLAKSTLKRSDATVRTSFTGNLPVEEDAFEDAVEVEGGSVVSLMARGAQGREFPEQDEDADMRYALQIQAKLDEERRMSTLFDNSSARVLDELNRSSARIERERVDAVRLTGQHKLSDGMALSDDDILGHVVAASLLEPSESVGPLMHGLILSHTLWRL